MIHLDPDQLCQQYLNLLYQTDEAYSYAESYKKKDLSATQGEILYGSINKFISALPLSDQDVFFDLGSGTGRITTQIFLKTPVKEACGIEFVPELHEKSLQIAQRVQRELPEFYADKRKLSFIEGNFLETSFAPATVVLINSVCFSQQTLRQVGELIEKNINIHSLLSLRPIPKLQRLRFIKTLDAECTWDSTLCYLYQS